MAEAPVREDDEPRNAPAEAPAADGSWSARIEQLLGQADAAATAGERVALLCQVAEIYERQAGDAQAAVVTLQAALGQDPASGRVVQEMERLARSSGRWAELIAATAEVAAGLEDRKQAADLWVQIAFWDENALGRLEDAIEAATTALEIQPAHGGALAMLESLHRRQRNWDGYVAVLERKRENANADPDRLAEGYREVLRFEPRHLGALGGLATIHEQAGDWDAAAEILGRLVGAVSPGEALLAARYRLGRLFKERLGDGRRAEEQLALALAMPEGASHVPTLVALAEIYRARGDWLKARQHLGRAADATADPDEKVRLLVAAAEICAGKLDDESEAARLYDEAIAIDPTRTDVVDRLAGIRFRRRDWAGLLPLAEFLVAKAEGGTVPVAEPAADSVAAAESSVSGTARLKLPGQRARLWYQLARAREATGDAERARQAYLSALALAPTGPDSLPMRRDFAAFAYAREDWADAADAYGALLSEHAAAFRRPELADYEERLGVAWMRAGEPARALASFEKVIANEPRRSRLLEAALEAAKAAGDDDAVVRHTHALLAVTEDRKMKRELLETVATIHRDRRNDPQRAIAAYREVLEAWPEERSIMHRLLELLTETKQWRASVQLLDRLAEVTEPGGRGPYYVAAGNVLAEELGSPAEAVEAFERALDADPNDLRIFEKVDGLVTAAHDWKTQARIYRRQIKRMGTDVAPEKRPVLLALWHALGEIYRTRLKDYPAAIAAFEVVATLDPDSVERHKILAELYRLAGPDTYPKAIVEERRLLERATAPSEMAAHLKMMLRLYVETGALDEAHAASASLVLLGKAEGEERALYDQYRPRGVLRAQGHLSEELWQRLLYHADEDRLLSHLLGTLSPVVALARARAPRDIGLKRKQRRDISNDPSLVCRAFAYGCAVLGLPAPEVYFMPESPGELEVANIRGTMSGAPAIVLGNRLIEATSDLEVAFIVGRTLAAVRPDHLLRWPAFVPTLAELEIALHAASQLVDSNRPVPMEIAPEVAKYRTFLDRTVPPQIREQLMAADHRWRAAHPGDGDDFRAHLGRWSRAACLTSVRAGLLLSGDLEVAARLGSAVAVTGGVDPSEVVRDLCVFGVSQSYFELRAALRLRNVSAALQR